MQELVEIFEKGIKVLEYALVWLFLSQFEDNLADFDAAEGADIMEHFIKHLYNLDEVLVISDLIDIEQSFVDVVEVLLKVSS